MDILQGERIRILRATILSIIYDNHRRGDSRLRLAELCGALDTLHYDVSPADLVMVLDDMKERGLLTFDREVDDEWTRRVRIEKIQISPRGRSLVQKELKDVDVRFV